MSYIEVAFFNDYLYNLSVGLDWILVEQQSKKYLELDSLSSDKHIKQIVAYQALNICRVSLAIKMRVVHKGLFDDFEEDRLIY